MSASEQILIALAFIFMLVLSGNVQADESNLVVFDSNGIIIKRAVFDNLSNCQSVGEAYTKQGFSYGCY